MPAASLSNATSTAVDLSRLPPPNVVEALDFETILDRLTADFAGRFPGFDAFLESDPAIKLLEVIAYQELVLRQRVNDAAQAVTVAFATGADLDNLAAFFGVTRIEIAPADAQAQTPAVMETDAALRRRILLSPDAYSVAGPTAAYVYHALSASGDVLDVSATSPAPGEVVISVLSVDGDGTASAELLALVEAAVAADDIRPLTDQVSVRSAEIVPVSIEARLTLHSGPDAELILRTALDRLADVLAENRRMGRDLTRSAIFAALHVAGVQNVDLVSPATDVVISPTQAAHAFAIDVTVGGIDE